MRPTLALFASALAMVALAAGGAPPESARTSRPVAGAGTDLVGAHRLDTGAVRIHNDGANLVVHVITQDGWELAGVNIFAATGGVPPPTTRRGTVVPSSFPFRTAYEATVTAHTQTIPLALIGAGCGDSVHTIVHAVVRRPLESGGFQEESVFGDGAPLPGTGFVSTHGIGC